jgi:ABC-type branched-subunit amino acid transport system ATPase component
MSAPLLHLDGVSHGYGAVQALHPLNLIAGSAATPTGRIRFDSRPITGLRNGPRARLGIGRTFQHPAVVDQLTAADNVSLAIRQPYRQAWSGSWRTERIRTALQQVGLAGHADTTAGRLSYGQRRLLELAVAFAARPRLLLLDEPSAGLDATEIGQIADIIRDLPDEVAVILVDHHLPLVFALATTVTVLAAGRHITTAAPQQVRADRTVQQVYLSPAPAANLHPATAEARAAAAPNTAPGSDTTSRTSRPATGEPTRPMLQVDGLYAAYHGAPVLEDIAVTVDAGSVHVVLGRNGAGKSTLLNTIAGLHRPEPDTRIRLDDIDLRPGRAEHAARHGIALVPQGRRLFATLSIREHLTLAGRRTRRRAQQGVRWSVDEVLDLLPALADKLHRYPGQLSGGEQQMAAIARALLAGPRMLLLDEPSEGLAPQVVDQLTATVTSIADAGVAVLLAEQTQRLALTVADRCSVLEHGRIAFTATTAQLGDPTMHDRIAGLLGVTAGSPT